MSPEFPGIPRGGRENNLKKRYYVPGIPPRGGRENNLKKRYYVPGIPRNSHVPGIPVDKLENAIRNNVAY